MLWFWLNLLLFAWLILFKYWSCVLHFFTDFVDSASSCNGSYSFKETWHPTSYRLRLWQRACQWSVNIFFYALMVTLVLKQFFFLLEILMWSHPMLIKSIFFSFFYIILVHSVLLSSAADGSEAEEYILPFMWWDFLTTSLLLELLSNVLRRGLKLLSQPINILNGLLLNCHLLEFLISDSVICDLVGLNELGVSLMSHLITHLLWKGTWFFYGLWAYLCCL